MNPLNSRVQPVPTVAAAARDRGADLQNLVLAPCSGHTLHTHMVNANTVWGVLAFRLISFVFLFQTQENTGTFPKSVSLHFNNIAMQRSDPKTST